MPIHQPPLNKNLVTQDHLFNNLIEFIKHFGIILDTAQKWYVILFLDDKNNNKKVCKTDI